MPAVATSAIFHDNDACDVIGLQSANNVRPMAILLALMPSSNMTRTLHTMTKLGDRSFAAAGPRLWNSLPGPLRQSETLTTFKKQLKTFF